MKSAQSFAREQRPVERPYSNKTNTGSNPLRPRPPAPKKKTKLVQPDVTKGDWTVEGMAIVSGKETIAIAAFGIRADLGRRQRDLSMLASAKKLDRIVRKLLNTFPAGCEDVRISALLDMAKEAIGGVA